MDSLRAQLSSIQESQRKTNIALSSYTNTIIWLSHSIGSLQTVPTTIPDGQYQSEDTTNISVSPTRTALEDSHVKTTSATSSINIYDAIYLQSPMLWRRLAVFLEMSNSSKYSDALTIATDKQKIELDPSFVDPAFSPASLLKKIQSSLLNSGTKSSCNDLRIPTALSDGGNLRVVSDPEPIMD
ncbi:MAG: hypothetical protein M1814_006306 [Vezdaea aestivalis]|nr:MAG: hypothetical protein M1814_006306 [Vezdaea aestivalis]